MPPSVFDARETRAVLLGRELVAVRWRREIADGVPELADAVRSFESLETDAARACARWLVEHGLDHPQESVPYLMVQDGAVLGFYALACGAAELRTAQRRELDLGRRTQPAILITQIARDRRAAAIGERLIQHAAVTARELARYTAATILALDPYDEDTGHMWQERFPFRPSETASPGKDWPRLYVPLWPAA